MSQPLGENGLKLGEILSFCGKECAFMLACMKSRRWGGNARSCKVRT